VTRFQRKQVLKRRGGVVRLRSDRFGA
jgi:hypothetical protein